MTSQSQGPRRKPPAAAAEPARLRRRRGPNAERRRATRGKILAAAVDCLARTGYAQTSTVRVADAAGVARGSLLHQFPTRVDLILAVARHAARAQGAFIRDGLAELPAGRERFVGSVDVTWRAFQQPEARALLEIIIATRHDPELAERIPAFAEAFEAAIDSGARRFAIAMGLSDNGDEAVAERRLTLVALRGLAIETMLSGQQAEPDAVLRLLRRSRERFFDAHHKPG
jgi:AcrR family transcriptional regulator